MVDERTLVWRRAVEEWASDHLDVEQIDAYLRGEVDALEQRRARTHFEACEVCRLMRDERTAAGIGANGPAIVLPLERLRDLGWMWLGGRAQLAAAGVESVTETESAASDAGRLDVSWSSTGELVAAVSQHGAPRAGWRVRLQLMSADGRVVSDKADARTGDSGRANLGRVAHRGTGGESFRLAAEPPSSVDTETADTEGGPA